MKFLNKMLIGAAALTMWSCSSEEPGGNTPSSDGQVFARISLSMDTRATENPGTQTIEDETDYDGLTNSTAGYEIGQDSENNINTVIVVLAQNAGTQSAPDFKYVTCSLSNAHVNAEAAGSDVKPTYIVRFESQALNDLVGNDEANLYVFAYCNPVQQVLDYFLEADGTPKETVGDFTNEVLQIAGTNSMTETTSIWTPNRFFMTNASLTATTITAQQLKAADSEANACDLGVVEVERAAARFDFANTTTAAGLNTYAIKDVVTQLPVANVEFEALALFNEAKDFYALRRVSANGQNVDAKLCGLETQKNWVVGPYAAQMASTPIDMNAFTGKYLFSFSEGGMYAINLNFTPFSALKNADDDNNWYDPANPAVKLDYYIWRYCTENTIPEVDTQVHGITTGVAFRAELKALANPTNARAQAIADAMSTGEDLYAFDGVLYGDRADLQAAADAQPGSPLQLAYQAAFVPENIFNGDLAKSVNGFTIYRATRAGGENHYYMYYYYYNRHNNNGLSTQMGPMEFDVVRNNVYKLSVDQVLTFGHPGDPGDDDDPEDPDDPDESPKTYFRVSVRVLPWVVRVNHIEF